MSYYTDEIRTEEDEEKLLMGSRKTMDRAMLEACASDYKRLEKENERLREGWMKSVCKRIADKDRTYTCEECYYRPGQYCQNVLDIVSKGVRQ